MKRLYFFLLLFAMANIAASGAFAQNFTQPPVTDSNWTRDYPPFRIAGDLYYVGTYDLACYYILTPAGNILINTGLAGSEKIIKKHIEQLGFKFSSIKLILTNQAHHDHVGAMAVIKKMTNAIVEVNQGDAEGLASGDKDDPAFGIKGSTFAGVKADILLHEHDVIKLGGMNIEVLSHPGHTKGSTSFLFDVKDEKRTYRVLIANMPSVVLKDADLQHGTPAYPNVAKDYAATFQKMKKLHFDLWLAAHAGQFDMHKKHKPGDAYNPMAFADQAGYNKALADLYTDYKKHLNSKPQSQKVK